MTIPDDDSARIDSQAVPVSSLLLVSTLLFGTGFCALAYETIWIRQFKEFFGATTQATAMVLAVFMGGLGLGAWILGPRMDRIARPLRAFAVLEAGVALTALLSPILIAACHGFYLKLGGEESLGSASTALVRMLCTTLALGTPAVLMGGSLPAAVASISGDSDLYRRNNALSYAANTLGAAAGVTACTFYLIEHVGMRSTLMLCCAANMIVAAVAYRYQGRLTAMETDGAASVNIETMEREAASDAGGVSVYLLAGLFGFVFFVMELIWFRTLSPLLGGTTFAFGLILTAVLLGIGTGSLAYDVATRWIKPSFCVLAYTAGAFALAVGLPFAAGDRIPISIVRAHSEIADFSQQTFVWCSIAAVVVLPAAVVSGFQFPLLIALEGRGRAHLGEHVGWTYAAGTLGAVGGLLFGGIAVLPVLGTTLVWRLLIVTLALASTSIVFISLRRSGKRWIRIPAFAMAAIAAACSLSQGPTAIWRHSGIGTGRHIEAKSWGPNDTTDWMNLHRRRIKWEDDGVNSTVAIAATDSLSLIINGKSDGNAIHDAGTQVGLGLIGPLLHPDGTSAMVIGAGTGETCGWLAAIDNIQHVTVIEMEPAVIEMVKRCAQVNHHVLENTKVAITFNDAREVVMTQRRRFDFVIAEPSNPYRFGVAALYTREFYEAVIARLKPGGMFLQWLQAYEIDFCSVLLVAATLRSVFPSMEIWQTTRNDLVFVCEVDAVPVRNTGEIVRRRNDVIIRDGMLRAWQVADVEGTVAHYVGGQRLSDGLVQMACDMNLAVNTDDRNQLEFAFAKSLGVRNGFSVHRLRQMAVDLSDDIPDWARPAIQPELLWYRRIAMATMLGDVAEISIPDDGRLGQFKQAMTAYTRRDYEEAVRLLAELDVDTTCPITCRVVAHALAELGRSLQPELMANLVRFSQTDADAIFAIANWRQDKLDAAKEHLLRLLDRLATDPWGDQGLITRCLDAMGVIGVNDPEFAERCVETLREPFAMYRCDDLRRLVRYDLASVLSPSEHLEAIVAFEPFVPWNKLLLADRLQIYRQFNHPLRHRARADFARFLEQER